jgi:hypothetical protein
MQYNRLFFFIPVVYAKKGANCSTPVLNNRSLRIAADWPAKYALRLKG